MAHYTSLVLVCQCVKRKPEANRSTVSKLSVELTKKAQSLGRNGKTQACWPALYLNDGGNPPYSLVDLWVLPYEKRVSDKALSNYPPSLKGLDLPVFFVFVFVFHPFINAYTYIFIQLTTNSTIDKVLTISDQNKAWCW